MAWIADLNQYPCRLPSVSFATTWFRFALYPWGFEKVVAYLQRRGFSKGVFNAARPLNEHQLRFLIKARSVIDELNLFKTPYCVPCVKTVHLLFESFMQGCKCCLSTFGNSRKISCSFVVPLHCLCDTLLHITSAACCATG